MTSPESLFRNAIDLNRYSNKVSKELITNFNDICVESVKKLYELDRTGRGNSYTAARLRSLVAQTTESMDKWAAGSSKTMINQLQSLAGIQSSFVEQQLQKVVPKGFRDNIRVNTVEISPKFAESVVTVDPTKIKSPAVGKQLAGYLGQENLTEAVGANITLPNGNILEDAFSELSKAQSMLFRSTVRDGLLSGQTTDQIARTLIGSLTFNDPAGIMGLAQKGGQLTTPTNHQVRTLVRTSINQVSNAASMEVYKANNELTKKYRYIATLDSRTSAICRSLDGRLFPYDKGPQPPQHFNCRSTIIAEIDYDNLPFDAPPAATRAAQGGPIKPGKDGEIKTYGDWLSKQPIKTRASVLGGSFNKETKKWEGAVVYYDRLAKKYGSQGALAKFVRADGTEVSLEQLQKRYGKPENIKKDKKKPGPKPVAKPKPTYEVSQGYKDDLKVMGEKQLKDVKSYLDDAVATGKKGTKMYEQNAAELKAVNAQLKKEQAAAKKKPKLAKLSAAEKSSINMDLANKYAAGDKLSDTSMASLNSSIKKEIEKLKKDSAKLDVQIKEAKAAPKKEKPFKDQIKGFGEKQLKDLKEFYEQNMELAVSKNTNAYKDAVKALKEINPQLQKYGAKTYSKHKLKVGKAQDPINNIFAEKKLDKWELKEHFDHWTKVKADLGVKGIGSMKFEKATYHIEQIKKAGYNPYAGLINELDDVDEIFDDLQFKGFKEKKLSELLPDEKKYKGLIEKNQTRRTSLKSKNLKRKNTNTTDKINYDYGFYEDELEDISYGLYDIKPTEAGQKTWWEKAGYAKNGKEKYKYAVENVNEYTQGSGPMTRAQYRKAFDDPKTRAKMTQYGKSQAMQTTTEEYLEMKKRIDSVEDFISRAPTYQGQIHRGVAVPPDQMNEFMESLMKGNSTLSMESWSTDLKMAQEFAGLDKGVDFGDFVPKGKWKTDANHVVMTVLDNKHGVPVRGVSALAHEQEVLMPTGVRYKMLGMQISSAAGTKNPVWEILLQQL